MTSNVGNATSVMTSNVGRNVSVETQNVGRNELNGIQLKILSLLSQNPKMTCAAIAEQIGVSKRSVERSVDSMKSIGVLRRKGATKNGTWEVVISNGLPPV